MKIAKIMSVLFFVGILSPAICCSEANPNVVAAEKSISKADVSGGVYSIKLPEIDAVMPAKPGREVVLNVCVTCHTPRYIMNQPALTRETWTAEITKMQKVFNAPIPAESVPTILEYLMAVRGKETK